MDTAINSPDTTKKWAAIDFFIHPRLRENSDYFYRARILVIILLAQISLPIIALATLQSEILHVQVVSQTLLASSVDSILQIALLYVLKKHGNYSACALLAIIQSFIVIAGMIAWTGGPFKAPPAQLIGIPCLMAFYFGGRRWGIAMTIVTIFTLSILITMQFLGFQFPNDAHDVRKPLSTAIIMPANFAIIMILALAYELTFFWIKKEHDEQHQKYVKLAKTDPLTGLANRRIFDETLAARIALYSNLTPIRSFGLCYLDLDKFKPINDQFGHDIGDEVLNAISTRLRSALRGADFIGRHGGDEFLMLLDSVQDADAATALSQRFLELIQEPIETSVGMVQVGGSLGFAIFPLHGSDTAMLQKAADYAMYEAKHTQSGFKIYSGSKL